MKCLKNLIANVPNQRFPQLPQWQEMVPPPRKPFNLEDQPVLLLLLLLLLMMGVNHPFSLVPRLQTEPARL